MHLRANVKRMLNVLLTHEVPKNIIWCYHPYSAPAVPCVSAQMSPSLMLVSPSVQHKHRMFSQIQTNQIQDFPPNKHHQFLRQVLLTPPSKSAITPTSAAQLWTLTHTIKHPNSYPCCPAYVKGMSDVDPKVFPLIIFLSSEGLCCQLIWSVMVGGERRGINRLVWSVRTKA